MTNSLLNGTNWHWRQGLKPMPIHCSKEDALSFRTQELYTLVQTMDQAKKILEELQQNGIKAEVKRTHSPHDIIPAGSLIVYSYIQNLYTLASYQILVLAQMPTPNLQIFV